MVRHILLAFDGSESSRRAAEFAHDLARQTGARITLLFVLEMPRVVPIPLLDSYVVTGKQPSHEEIARIEQFLEQAVADLPAADVQKVVEVGTPVETICRQAAAREVDLIVMGARGLSEGGRWLLGSVSDRVVHHADRPVTVVR